MSDENTTTKEDQIGDVWRRFDEDRKFYLMVVGKFNDWSLLMRSVSGEVCVYPLKDLRSIGFERMSKVDIQEDFEAQGI